MAEMREPRCLRTIPLLIVTTLLCTAAGARTIYVDDDGSAFGDGASWETAHRYLQDALAEAEVADEPIEIHVAQGTYKPNESKDPLYANRNGSFLLPSGTILKGGYAGLALPDPNACSPKVYETVLTGDFRGDDLPLPRPLTHLDYGSLNDLRRDDNSTAVVAPKRGGSDITLEGVVITAACPKPIPDHVGHLGSGLCVWMDAVVTARNCVFRANAAPGIYCEGSTLVVEDCIFDGNIAERGGGIYVQRGDAHLTRCTLVDNWAWSGGALYHRGGLLSVEHCTFARNTAAGLNWADTGCGGALQCDCASDDSAIISDCHFIDNIASTGGAAHFGYACGLTPPPLGRYGGIRLTKCTFTSNEANFAGAIHASAVTLDVLECVFRGNSSVRSGGAVSIFASGTSFAQCLFCGNSALSEGGCVLADGLEPVTWRASEHPLDFDLTLDNCTLVGNRAPKGRAIACRSSGSQEWDRARVSDSILDNGEKEIHNPDGSQMVISYTNVRGGTGSVYDPCDSVTWAYGNVHADACFADPGYWDPNGTPDYAEDDFWIDGDYHLKSQAGRRDAATDNWVTDDITSPCIDAGDPSNPIGYEPFPNGGRINMGAYGGTAEASKSWFGEPACETIIAGDINGDCRVDFRDLQILSLHWLGSGDTSQE